MATVKEMVTELYNLYSRVASLEYENELLKANNLKALQSTEYVWDKTFEINYSPTSEEDGMAAIQELVQEVFDHVAPKVQVKAMKWQQRWNEHGRHKMCMWLTVGGKDDETIIL